MLRRVGFFVPWLLGFVVVFNVHLFPFTEKQPQATDLLGVLLGLWLLWQFATRGISLIPFGALLLVFVTIPLLWGLYASSIGDIETTVHSIRWLLAVPWGYALFSIARNPQQRRRLVWGLWWGAVGNAAVLLVQYYGLVELTQDVGLAARDSVLSSMDELHSSRAPGMHNHPNSSTAVVSLVVPLSLYLYYFDKTRIWVTIASLGTLFAATTFTLTRSALIAAGVTILASFFFSRNLKPSLRLLVLLALGGLPTLLWWGPPAGWQRWLDIASSETSYSSLRFLSNARALNMALEYPLGLGVEGGEKALLSEGLGASHNAFLQTALSYGPLLAGALALLMFILVLQILPGLQIVWPLEVLLALHLFILFFFEEHLRTPSFVILTAWLIAGSAVQIAATLKWRRPVRAASVP